MRLAPSVAGSECVGLDTLVTTVQTVPAITPFTTSPVVLALNQPTPANPNLTFAGNGYFRFAFIYYEGLNPSPVGGDYDGDVLCSIPSRRVGACAG